MSKLWLSVALIASACGSPEEIDRDRFPTRDQAGYPDAPGSASSTATPSLRPQGGATSSLAAATVGSGAPKGECPEDITLLFNRPIQRGGCQGAGCHIPGNTAPDLVSPHPEQRLLGVVSRCNGRPYIAAGDSFLVDKITHDAPECGAPMPFLMPEALSAADEACILAWIDQISAG